MRLSYANIVSTLALLVAVAGGGTALAATAAKNSVTTDSIRDNAVTGAKVKNGSLGGADIKNGSLGGADIKNGSLGGADIANHSLGGIDIAERSIDGSRIVANSVTSGDIADDTVSSNDIADHTISGTDVAPNSLGFGVLSSDAVKQISQYWDANAVSPGSVLSGFGYVAAAVGTVGVSFPAPVTGLPSGDQTGCQGSYEDPTAPAGSVCVYPEAGSTTVASTNSRGFLVTGADVAFTWAYTAG